jgi:anti-sigma factor RsiW
MRRGANAKSRGPAGAPVLTRRQRRLESRRAGAIIPCPVAREALSALVDGEEPAITEASVTDHLGRCQACREFRASVVSITRRMRVRALAPVSSRATEILGLLGCAGQAPATRPHGSRRWAGKPRFSWVRATQWAAGIAPLGFAVPALALGMFAHIHIVPSHVLTPCTMSLRQAQHR